MIYPQDVLDYWFGPIEETKAYLEGRNAIWWRKNPKVDEEITSRFKSTLEAIAAGKLSEWQTTPEGWCASILVLDQFSRHIYRGTPRSFSQDTLAISLARKGLGENKDQTLHVIQRVFMALPFEHSELLEDQHFAVRYLTELAKKAPLEWRTQIHENADYARQHLRIIERFGRFPHRNAILGRTSTGEEVAFLKEPGSSF